MKIAATATLLFATLALANPAPIAQPEADAAPVAQPLVETRDPEVLHSVQLDARGKKPKTGSGSGSGNDTSAADIITPSRALQLGALGFGVIEVVRLWG